MFVQFDYVFLVFSLHRIDFSVDRFAVRRPLRPKDRNPEKKIAALFSRLSLRHSCGSASQRKHTQPANQPAVYPPNRTATQRQHTYLQLPLHTQVRTRRALHCTSASHAVSQPAAARRLPHAALPVPSLCESIDRPRSNRSDQLSSRSHDRAQRG